MHRAHPRLYLLRTKGNLPQLAQGYPDPAVPYGSAYWGAPAAHTRAREVVGAAESDPNRPCRL